MNDKTETHTQQDPERVTAIDVYWRPGCPFCVILRRGLASTGWPLREIDIWQDSEAAALVRSLADGNETVPTVVVGNQALINPTVRHVRAAVRAQAPHLLDDLERPRRFFDRWRWPWQRP